MIYQRKNCFPSFLETSKPRAENRYTSGGDSRRDENTWSKRQKWTASLWHTFSAAVVDFREALSSGSERPELFHPVSCAKRAPEPEEQPVILRQDHSMLLCPPQLNSYHHLHLFLLWCVNGISSSCSTWDKAIQVGNRFFCRKGRCRRVAESCNTWLNYVTWSRFRDSWPAGELLSERHKHTPHFQTTSRFKERQLSSDKQVQTSVAPTKITLQILAPPCYFIRKAQQSGCHFFSLGLLNWMSMKSTPT